MTAAAKARPFAQWSAAKSKSELAEPIKEALANVSLSAASARQGSRAFSSPLARCSRHFWQHRMRPAPGHAIRRLFSCSGDGGVSRV